jgi:hypothetical protein
MRIEAREERMKQQAERIQRELENESLLQPMMDNESLLQPSPLEYVDSYASDGISNDDFIEGSKCR